MEMEPRMGNGKTEPMESLENWINGKFASLDSKCRKVTTHKCPHINVLNIEMEPRKGEGDNQTNWKLENWTNGNLHLWFFECRKVTTHKCLKLLAPSKFGSLVFQVSTFKTFMHGHLCMVTFPHLENQRCKFSIDSIFWTFCWFIFPHHPS